MTMLFSQVEFVKHTELEKLKRDDPVEYARRKRLVALQGIIDEAFELDEEIKALTQKHIEAKAAKLTALKQKIERNILAEGLKWVESSKGKATRSQSNIKVFDEEGFNTKYGIKPESREEFITTKLGNPSVRLYPKKSK